MCFADSFYLQPMIIPDQEEVMKMAGLRPQISDEEAEQLYQRMRNGGLQYGPTGKVLDADPGIELQPRILDVTEVGHAPLVRQFPRTSGHYQD